MNYINKYGIAEILCIKCISRFQEIKKIIASLRLKTVPELCVVCQEPIAFERRLDGRCSNGHGALRCRATLLTCFDVIRTCRWCNAYYNSDAGNNLQLHFY